MFARGIFSSEVWIEHEEEDLLRGIFSREYILNKSPREVMFLSILKDYKVLGSLLDKDEVCSKTCFTLVIILRIFVMIRVSH